MITKKYFFTTVFIVLLAFTARPTTWATISSGMWSNSAVWSTGIVPPLTSADTFIIKSPIAIQNNIIFNSGAFMKIDSTGGICGHHNITVKSGARITKFGILELDTLFIAGGIVTCLATGQVILTCYGVLTNGGSLSVNGCSLAVGPWFSCVQPEYAFLASIEEMHSNSSVVFYPNPSDGNFTLEYKLSSSKAVLKIINLLGEAVYTQTINGSEGSIAIKISEFGKGIYFWKIISDDRNSPKGKIEVLK